MLFSFSTLIRSFVSNYLVDEGVMDQFTGEVFGGVG